MTLKGLKGTKITIGSDPEFVLYDTKKHSVIVGYEFFSDKHRIVCPHAPKNGCWGKENICNISNNFCRHSGVYPVIGNDGTLGELRPPAAELPLQHVEIIQNLLRELKPCLGNDIVIRAETLHTEGSEYRMALGGHIHVGMSTLLRSQKHKLARYLSYYCGIPLKKIERIEDIQFRGWTNGSYGYFGGYNTKSYGIEWRMPASWLLSKEMATSALSLAYVVAQDFTVAKNVTVKCSAAQYHELLDGDIAPIIDRIKSMKYYKYYRHEIDLIFEMIANKQTWNTDLNIMEQWSL